MTEAPTLHGDGSSPGNGRLERLEQRMHRLEDAVAALQDTRQLEERLVERVVDRLLRNPPAPRGEAASMVIEAPRPPLLPALGILRSIAGTPPEATPAAAPVAQPSWLLTDTLTEARAMFRMFFDVRFRVSRTVELLSLGLVILILTSWYWFPGTSLLPGIVSSLLVKAADLILAYVLFKILSREARRYRAAWPHPLPTTHQP